MAKPFRWSLYVLGVFAALLALAFVLVRTAWFQRELQRRIISTLEDFTGARVEIRQLYFQPARFQVIFRGFIFHGTERPPEQPLFLAAKIVIGFTPASLLQRRLLLRSVDVEDGELHVYRYPDATTNVPPLRRQNPLEDLINLAIGRLSLVRTRAFLDDQHLALDLAARDISVLLRFVMSGHYSGKVSAREVNLTQRDVPLPPISFSTQLDFSNKDLKLSSLTWQTARTTGRGTLNLRIMPSIEGDLALDIRGELPEIARTLGLPELRSGTFRLDSHARYRSGQFEARGRFEGHQLLFHSASFQPGYFDFAADYSADPKHIEIPNLVLSALGGSAQGRAEISLQETSPRFAVSANLHALELDRAIRSFPNEPSLGRLTLAAAIEGKMNATWHGKFQNLTSQFDVDFHASHRGRAGARAVSGFARGKATLTPAPSVQFQGAQLKTDHSMITAEGFMSVRHSNLAFRGATSDFEEWRPLFDSLAEILAPMPLALKSTATFDGTLSGPFEQPLIRGKLKVGRFEYGGWAWDSLETNVTAAPTLVEASSGRLLGGTSQLKLNVSLGLSNWRLTSQSPVRVDASAQRAPIEGLRDALNLRYPLTGLATGRVDLHGTLSNLAGTGSFRVERARFAGEPLDLLSADLRASGPTVHLENIQLVKGSGRATGEAGFNPTTRAFSAKLHGTGFSLAEIRRLSARPVRSKAVPDLQGVADFDLSGQGTADNVELQSKLNIRDISVKGISLGNFGGQLDWHGEDLQIQGEFAGAGGDFKFNGRARTRDEWPLELTGRYTNFRADPWIKLWRPRSVDAAITVSGEMSVSGPLKDPRRLAVRDRTENLQLNFVNLTWRNDRPIEFTVANRILTVNRFQLRGPSTNFEVEGSVQLGPPAALGLTVQGDVDASLLTFFDPSLMAAGRFNIQVRANGSPSEPQLFGTIHVDDVSFGYADVPVRLAGLKGDLELEGERLTIRSLRGERGQGSLNLTGFLTLSQPPRMDIRADFDRARVEYPIDFTDLVSGSLHLVGTTQDALLTGDVAVKQMFVAEDFDLMAWMAEIASRTSPRIPGESPSTVSKIRLDVGVASDPAVRLDSRELKTVATIDMRLKGNLAAPVAFGDIHIQSGEALFRGNRYKLTRGDIALTNPLRTEALLDLEAKTRIEHYDVTLNITGPSDRARIGYRSDPPLPSTDVLLLLAFGRAQQEQALTAGTSSSTGALLSQALSGEVSSRVQRLFGISRMRVDPNVGGLVATGGSRITVEQQVAPNLSITYIANTATSQQRIIHFDWDINDRTELIGERDQNGVFGLELRFRRRFK